MRIFNWFRKPKAEAIPPVTEPKVRGGQLQTIPTYLSGAKGSNVASNITNITNLDLVSYARNENSINATIKKLVVTSPDLSHSVQSKIKSALSKKFTAIAKSEDGRIDPKATESVNIFLQRINNGVIDYTRFAPKTDIRSLSATLLFDHFRYDSMMLELVLGKTRFPAYLKPVPTANIKWANDSPNVYPIYKGPTEDIHLNFPTIIYSASTQDAESAYADSPLQAAIQACMWDQEFINDLRRAATKNLLQRLKITIDSEKFLNTLPLEVKTDAKKQTEYMDNLIVKLETQLANLEPDDSLVLFDIMTANTIADANRSEDRTITVLQALIDGKISAGAKILPSILGRGSSSNAASTESLLFLKSISSSQLELNNLLSRALTLAVRLMGHDAYVSFEFEEVNLRPGLELESFKSIRQDNLIEQWSLGLLTDDEASILITGALPPKGFKPLSGTMFHTKKPLPTNNDYSNTSVSQDGKTDSTQAQKTTEGAKK